MPLSVTDARYTYRCIDTALQQSSRLVSFLHPSRKLSKTLFSKALNTTQSIRNKLERCSSYLLEDPDYDSARDVCLTLVSYLNHYLSFPPRYISDVSNIVTGITSKISDLSKHLNKVLKKLGIILIPKKEPRIETPKELSQFFLKAQERGWKVTLPEPEDDLVDPDPFLLSSDLVKTLAKPYNLLLDEKVQIGVLAFPIVLLDAYRMTKTEIAELNNPQIGYKSYSVFGSYLVLESVYLLGIHQNLVIKVSDGKNTRTDISRFRHLVPYVEQLNPEMSDILAGTAPTGPTQFAKNHYYCPLVPITVANQPTFNLGNWSFLTKQ